MPIALTLYASIEYKRGVAQMLLQGQMALS